MISLYPIYYVFDGYLMKRDGTVTDEQIRFCCSNVSFKYLNEEMANGDILIDPHSLNLVHKTYDRNEARSMATEF